MKSKKEKKYLTDSLGNVFEPFEIKSGFIMGTRCGKTSFNEVYEIIKKSREDIYKKLNEKP